MAQSPADLSAEYIPFSPSLVSDSIYPLLIAMYITCILFGLSLFQFWSIGSLLRLSSGNEILNWIILTFFWLLDLADQITKCIYFSQFIYGVATHGIAAGKYKSPTIIVTLGLFGGLVPTAVHCFYIKRLYLISRTWKYRYIVWLVLLFCFVASLGSCAWGIRIGIWATRPLAEYATKVKTLPIPWLAGDAMVDVILCGLLCGYLFTQRTEFASTNRMLARWIAITMETGLIPAGLAIADLLVAINYPTKPYYIALLLILSKAYINSVLVLFYTVTKNRVIVNFEINSLPQFATSKVGPGLGGYGIGLGTGVGARSYRSHRSQLASVIVPPTQIKFETRTAPPTMGETLSTSLYSSTLSTPTEKHHDISDK